MEYRLKEYFKRYLADVRGVSSSSVNHYLDAINWISKYLVNKGLLQASLYEILDLELLDQLTGILLKDSSFIEMNKRGHQMYTAGLNNYLRFAKGEGFERIRSQVVLMDVPMDMPGSTTSLVKKQKLLRLIFFQRRQTSSKHKFGIQSKNWKILHKTVF